jgi:integrase
VPLPPEAVEAIRPLLPAGGEQRAVFCPRLAVALRPRTTAHPAGWRERGRSAPTATDRYTATTYGQCLTRACKAEGVPVFRPYDLRHLAVTRWAETLGVEAARVLAGHTTQRMTAQYVHTDPARIAALLLPKKAG